MRADLESERRRSSQQIHDGRAAAPGCALVLGVRGDALLVHRPLTAVEDGVLRHGVCVRERSAHVRQAERVKVGGVQVSFGDRTGPCAVTGVDLIGSLQFQAW